MSASPTFPDRDLLVLAHDYKNFTKNQVDLLAERFRTVTVVVRYNRFADVASALPIDLPSFERHGARSRIDETDRPANVTVVPLPLLYLPIETHYRRLGDQHYRALRRVLDGLDAEFDLVHAHFTWTSGYVASRLKRDAGIPYVITVHENEDWLYELYESDREKVYAAWREADTVVRVNEKDVPLLTEFNDDVRSIPNGFSRDEYPIIDRDAARAAVDVPPDRDLVFGLGALTERKRWHHLVDVMAHIAPDRAVTCVIAGGGEQSSLRQRIDEHGLEDVVHLLGYIPQDELAQWMTAADILVLPSVAEGNPTVMFEALGCGTPYVGTAVGGVSEIITSEEYGLTCEPDDPDALAAIVEEGLDRDWDREKIRAYGDRFTWRHIVDQYAEVFDELLERRQPATNAQG